VYVHCLDDVGVTGLLIMCLRKVLHWAPPSIFAEFSRFARDAADTPLPFTPTLIDAALPSVERTVKAVKEVMYLVK
jgi:hypothetical protein